MSWAVLAWHRCDVSRTIMARQAQSGLSADHARGQSGWSPDQARGHRGLSGVLIRGQRSWSPDHTRRQLGLSGGLIRNPGGLMACCHRAAPS